MGSAPSNDQQNNKNSSSNRNNSSQQKSQQSSGAQEGKKSQTAGRASAPASGPARAGGDAKNTSSSASATSSDSRQPEVKTTGSKSAAQKTSSESQGRMTNSKAAARNPASTSGSGASSSNSQLVRVENDDFVFETFHHKTGKSYVCLFYGGQRYYLDSWDSQEWKPFPSKWYAEGNLVRDDGKGSISSTSTQEIDVQSGFNLSDSSDDREGFFSHPKRGQLATYMVEEKRNVMYFYDDSIGLWVKAPAAWEAKADFMRPIIAELKAAIPAWKDEIDIVAALRQSGYDPDDAIATFITVGLDDPIVAASAKGTTKQQVDALHRQAEAIKSLESRLKEKDSKIACLEASLAESERSRKQLEQELLAMNASLNTVKADNKNTVMQMQGVQREKTKLLREKTELMGGSLKGGAAKGGGKGGASPVPLPIPVVDSGPKITKEMELMIKAANEKAKKIDEQHNNLKDFVIKELDKLKLMLKQLAESYFAMRNGESDLGSEIEEVRALYRKEMLQRKLLYNELQELRGNIRVFCRIKPDKSICLNVDEDSVSMTNVHGKRMVFEFDKVYGQKITQSEIFENTKAVITSAVDGYNVCIIAYGQTGSGKTHTMMGPEKDPGVNLRAVQELLMVAKQREKVSVKISANMLEVYNEQVKDLLRDPKDKNPKEILIRIVGKSVTIENALEMEIKAVDDVKKMIKRGDENRHVTATKMNTNSSRSHLVLRIQVEITDNVTGGRTIGSLTLVDLAGSEKISKSGAEGQTLIEAAAINKSLSALGQIFSALRSKSVHVPYRNSKLTQLLQPSLGGDAKACMFINISPLESNAQETLSTLEFGQNAKQVQLGKATQNIAPPPKPGAKKL